MADFIEREKEQVRIQVQSFKSLVERIEKERYRIPHLDDFRNLIEYLQEALETDLSERLRLITSGLPEREQSQQLAEFRYRIKRLFDTMYGFLLHSFDVPRELYFLSDIFLEHHDIDVNYIISVSDEISLWPLTILLQELGFRDMYPEFWQKISTETFFIVQIISEVAKEDKCLDWPLILHEFAHIICFEKGTEDTYFDAMSIIEALRTIGALEDAILFEEDPLVELATKKLYATEYLADLLVTRCFGAFYGWRFLKGWFRFRDIFEPDRYHPPSDKRIERVAIEVRDDLGMPTSSDFLFAQLEAHGGSLSKEAKNELSMLDIPQIIEDVENALYRILPETRAYADFALTPEKIEQTIRRSPWFQTMESCEGGSTKSANEHFDSFAESLHEAFLRGEPIIVDPFILYFLLTLDFSNTDGISELDEPDAEQIRKLVADAIRLYAVQKRYSSDGF